MLGAKESFDIIQTIKSHWEKKTGLLFSIILLGFIYYPISKEFNIVNPYNIIIPFLLAIVVIVLWYLTTNRILLYKSNKLGIYVCINCDNDFELKAKAIFEKAIEEINRDQELNMLYVGFVPSNLFSTHNEIETWLDKQNGNYNAIIFLKIKNGKINSEEAIKIDGASYTGFFKNNNLSINGENLNIMQDLNLRLQNTDWNYLEKNCLDDKEKFRSNLKDLILYYGGMFYLNESHFENSRIILKKLYNPALSIVPAKKDPNNSSLVNLEVNHNHIKAGRLNYLLTNIYLKCVINKHNENNTNEAINLLHEVESFPIPPDVKSIVYINLAYMYYMINNIERSKYYTSQIQTINPKSFAYLINLGFYAIIENNIIAFSQHYSIIDENIPLDSQPVEIIAFLNDRQETYSNSILLIESAVAILTKLFVDENDGNNKLKIVNDKIPSTNQYKALKRLVEKTLKRRLSKKIQRQMHKAKKAA